MIRYLKHKELDKGKWDKCIDEAENGLIYAYSWYLDIVSPNWDALVEGDYEAVMPLTWKRKWGIKYIAQPIFTQQLGWFGKFNTVKRLSLPKDIQGRYLFGFMNLNSTNKISTMNIGNWVNLILKLGTTYDEMKKNYSSSHRNNLKKALKNNLKIEPLSLTDFETFYKTSGWANKFDLNPKHFSDLLLLVERAFEKKMGRVLGVINSEKKVVSLCLILESHFRLTTLFSISDEAGYKTRAQFLLIDKLIRDYAGSSYLLDFEGSSIEGIASFYKGFGASVETYYRINFFRYRFLRLFLKRIIA